MDQYYYIVNDSPKYMKPIKPKHDASFSCKFVTKKNEPIEEVVIEQATSEEETITEQITTTEQKDVNVVEETIQIESVEVAIKPKKRGRKATEKIEPTTEE